MSNRETNPGFEASPDGKLRTNWRTVGVVVGAVIAATLVVSRYTNALENTIQRFDEKLTNMSNKLDAQQKTTKEELDKLRTEFVPITPFYAWNGRLRYEFKRADNTTPVPDFRRFIDRADGGFYP